MKKKIVSILVCAAMVVVLAAGCGSNSNSGGGNAAPTGDGSAATEAPAGDDAQAAEAVDTSNAEVTLRVQSHDPEQSATGTFLNAWAADVEAASNGRIDIEVYHGGTLGGPKDTLDMLRNGTCDIGWGLQSFFPDTFPVTEVFMLPNVGITEAPIGSQAIWDFYNSTDYMDAEYSEFHVLLLHTNCQSPITTVGKKVEKVSELQGMDMRGNAGPPNMFIEAFGGQPQSCPINDLYQNLNNNVYAGCITDWHGISAFKINEVSNGNIYFMDENVGLSTYYMMINQNVYDGLPDDLKKILDDTTAEAIKYTSAWNDVEAAIKATAEEAGQIYKLSDEERANLDAIEQQVVDQWIAGMNDKGYDGQAIYDKAMECIANAQK